MNTNMTGFKWFSKVCVLVLWTKVAVAIDLRFLHQFLIAKVAASSIRVKSTPVNVPLLCLSAEGVIRSRVGMSQTERAGEMCSQHHAM